ncbi:HAMP domain-containing sensor histidine kinase [Sphingobacterium sp.]|uniref:sensor histidine kinase n=1 Tax=Sphingobacterium sp. TaxID=341027 RepID=UPI0028A83B3C|nr:HAMP domain-containing sensor histidine kinase [Sphingobacterium sp.]
MNHSFRFFMGSEKVPENLSDILELIHREDRESLLRELEGLGVKPIEKRAVRFWVGGNVRHIRLTLYQTDISGSPECVGFAEDFTEEFEFQQNILSHNAKKNAILNILSHDIAGAFATLRNLTDLAIGNLENGDTDPMENALSAMRDICMSTMSLIKSFLKKEFISSLSVPLNMVRVDLVSMIRDFIDQFAKMEPQHGVFFVFRSDFPIILMDIDEDKLIQVLNNLISNSLKFTSPGGTITVSLTDFGEKAGISVRDTGIGIPEAMKSQVFSKFNDHKRGGLNGEKANGIGLWAVKTVVEWMGGKVDFESHENEGTEFFLEFPKTFSHA